MNRSATPKGPLREVEAFEHVQNLEQHDKAESSLAKSVVGRWGETLILGLMVLDMLLLTSLLYFSGGPSNPFVIFYLVNILLVAVLARPLWSAILTILAFLCYGLLFIDHRPLPVRVAVAVKVVASANGIA